MPASSVLTRSAAALALLALPLGVAGCGGSKSTTAPSSVSPSSSSTTPATPSAPSSVTSSSAPSSTTSSSAVNNAGKPSKAAAEKGLVKILQSTTITAKVPAAKLKTIATCAVEKSYDALTPTTLKAMATGDVNSKPDQSDAPGLTAAITYCAKASGVSGITS